MKLENDEFEVKYVALKLDEAAILAACEKSGFPAEVVTQSSGKPTDNSDAAETESYKPPEFFVKALESAKQEGKPIVLDFTATWCAPCQMLAKETFVDPAVAPLLEKCILHKVDTDEFPAMAKHFGVVSLPDIRFMNPNGEEFKQLKGFQEAEPFSKELKELLETHTN